MPTDTFKTAVHMSSDNCVLTTHDGGSVAYQHDALYVLPVVTIPQPTIALTRIDCWLDRLFESALDCEYGYSTAKAAEELGTFAPPSFGKLAGNLNRIGCHRTVIDTDDGHVLIYIFHRENKRATSVPHLQVYIVQTISAAGNDHPTVTYICNHNDLGDEPKMSIAHSSLGAKGSLKVALSITPSIDEGNYAPPTHDLLPAQVMYAPGTEMLSDEDKLLCLYFQPLSGLTYQVPVKKGVKVKTDNAISFPYTEYANLVHRLTKPDADASDELPPPPEEVVVPEELLGSKLDNSNGGKTEVTPLPKSVTSIKEVKACAARNNAALVNPPGDSQEQDVVKMVESESFPRGTASDIDNESFTEASTASFIEENGGLLLSEMNDEQVEMLKSGWPAMYKHATKGGRVILPRQSPPIDPTDFTTAERKIVAESPVRTFGEAEVRSPFGKVDFIVDELTAKIFTLRDPNPQSAPKEEIAMPKQSVPTGDDSTIPEGYVKEGDIIDALNAARIDLANFLKVSTVISEAVRNRLEGTLATLTTIVVMGTMIPEDIAQFGDAIITAAIVADSVRSPAPRYEASTLDRRERAEDFHNESLRNRDVRNERQDRPRGRIGRH